MNNSDVILHVALVLRIVLAMGTLVRDFWRALVPCLLVLLALGPRVWDGDAGQLVQVQVEVGVFRAPADGDAGGDWNLLSGRRRLLQQQGPQQWVRWDLYKNLLSSLVD